MFPVWAIARHMIAEGVRMRIALVFLVLIGLVVLGLPFSISGDNSVTGAVQAFMSYACGATGFLLGLLTILLSKSLSDDLVNQQIFLVMAKPIARWQYVLGKWLGLTLLNAVFLGFSGLCIYGMVHYIKHTKAPLDPRFDEAELRNEVLIARHATPCKLPNFAADAEFEYQRNLEEGLYTDLPEFDPAKEIQRLAKKHEARWRIVAPFDYRVFEFENILCDRSREKTVQLRYKTEVSQYPPDEIFRAVWRFGDAYKGTPEYMIPVRHVVGRFHTIRVPADAVAEDHSLLVRFINQNPYEGEPLYRNVMEFRASDGVEVLFVVGSFEGNLLRLLILMMCKLIFLAAVAVLMVTFLSFPVACLTSFTVYVLAGARSFLADALDMASDDTLTMFSSVKEFLVQSLILLYDAVHWVIPDFGKYDAVETFVNGRNVSLVWVLQGVSELVLIKTLIVLLVGMLLFQRREVAEVSF